MMRLRPVSPRRALMAPRKKTAAGPTYYTTYQVSKVLGVSLPTVVNWVNDNLLDAHRTPGGHRRIARNDLITFAREYNYPLSNDFLSEDGDKHKILVVDDEQEIGAYLLTALVRLGHDVDTAIDGEAAWHLISQKQYDLILTDLKMPGITGFKLYNLIKEKHPDLLKNILVMTGDIIN